MTGRRTLATEVTAEGVALHAGVPARITFHPAVHAGGGIVFVRADGKEDIEAYWENVASDERLNTCLTKNGETIKLVEHVMAALAGAEIDDCIVEVDGPEPPILDGAALAYLDLFAQAGTAECVGTRRLVRVLQPVEVTEDGARARLLPASRREFAFEIEFTETGRQQIDWVFTPETFRTDIAPARTFGRIEDRETYAAAGYGRGADLTNTLVFEKGRLMNADAQRFPDEFVRHKVLDAVGDLYLSGDPLIGRFEGYRSSHRLNNALLRALFADPANYEIVAA
jgi:UDP-3-O-[3-hydroxymyristoyl] N-acetylglucosamine deacetylase